MNKIYSTAHLMGGLGNQMFQIAHSVCQGWKNNIESVFKPVSYTPMQGNQPKKYINNVFRNINFVDNIEIGEILREESWNQPNIKPVWDKTIEFYGYFQSSKNFLGYENEIKKLFEPTDYFINKISEIYPQISLENTLSIHIRRGDYLNITNVLPIIDKTYIEFCLDSIPNYSHIFIFSDDKEWVKRNINYPNSTIVEGLEDYEELWMISLCKNNIMSNSSFSWWGSFLNKNNEKIVMVPDIWFGDNGPRPYDNIYEPYHKKIKVKLNNGNLII